MSNHKKNFVKRDTSGGKSSKNRGYMRKKEAIALYRTQDMDFIHRKTMDCVIITLNSMGCDEEFIHNFFNAFSEVETEIDGYYKADLKKSQEELVSDGLTEELRYAETKHKVDQLLKQSVYPEEFIEYDYRYGIKEMKE